MAKTYPWGGFKNGCIPTALLTTVRGELFEREAAGYLVELEAAFEKRFGHQAIILQGYRALGKSTDPADTPTQWGIYNEYRCTDPLRASYPGTSPHGYGRSSDFASGVDVFGTPEKEWMDANAPTFGWHPTGNDFPRKEAWHFDYIPSTATGATVTTAASSATSKAAHLPEQEHDMILVRRVTDGDPTLNGLECAMGPGFFQHLDAGSLEGIARDLKIPAEKIVDGAPENSNGLPAIEFTRLVSLFQIPPGYVKPGGRYLAGGQLNK